MAVQIISSKRSVLNGTGISIPGQVTYLIDGEADIDNLALALCGEYDVEPDVARRDVETIVEEWINAGVVEK